MPNNEAFAELAPNTRRTVVAGVRKERGTNAKSAELVGLHRKSRPIPAHCLPEDPGLWRTTVMPGPGQFEFSSPTLRDAYALFRLDRQGNLVTPNTLEHYDRWCGYFFDWLEKEDPGSKTLADLAPGRGRHAGL